jgi:hypothetical protein
MAMLRSTTAPTGATRLIGANPLRRNLYGDPV